MTNRRRCLHYLGHVLRMESERLVLKTLMALTKERTEYPPGSLFMDVEDIPCEELLSLASDKSYWKALVVAYNAVPNICIVALHLVDALHYYIVVFICMYI